MQLPNAYLRCGFAEITFGRGFCRAWPRAAQAQHPRLLICSPDLHDRMGMRPCVCASAAAAPSPSEGGGDASKRAAVQESVQRASTLLGEMLEEVMRTLFVEQAAAYISEEGPAALSEAEAVRGVVVQRIEFLDANFLAALNRYIEVTKKQSDGAQELLPLLELLRNEVLFQVSLRLPPAARVLNRVLQEVDKDARVAVLRTSLAGGSAELPGCDADALSTAASQFIEDMEDQEIVADRRLLARLCLVREEVRWVAAEVSFTNPTASTSFGASQQDGPGTERVAATHFARSNVPQRPAAFINQLVSVSQPAMRSGLITRAFCEDWEGAAPRQKPQSAAHKGQPDFVRPGRFMSTLQAMIQNLEGESSSEPPAVGPGVLKRLADIQMEAISALDRMQRGEVQPPTS